MSLTDAEKNRLKKAGLTGLNKPKKTPSHKTKKAVVAVRDKGKVKLIRFGDQKMGHTFKPELSDAQKKQLGQELRRKFLDAIPGLEPLIDAVKQRVRDSGRLRGLDGRPIFCRAEHASLNYLLQSAGAILSKRWVVVGQELLDAAGLTYDVDYTRCAYIHDEVQLSVVPAEADRVAQILEAAAPKAGQYYRFRVPITAAAGIGKSWQETH